VVKPNPHVWISFAGYYYCFNRLSHKLITQLIQFGVGGVWAKAATIFDQSPISQCSPALFLRCLHCVLIKGEQKRHLPAFLHETKGNVRILQNVAIKPELIMFLLNAGLTPLCIIHAFMPSGTSFSSGL
jgi:hypothetical protein